jgi:hypothetical protein
MSILRTINETEENIKRKLMTQRARQSEIKKFQDSRRVEIYSKVNLTKEQEAEIDSLYLENYGEKIPYTWHRHYTAFTGNFDKYYFPELLFIPEFEAFMNPEQSYVDAFEDKNILPYMASSAGIKMPSTKFSSVAGLIKDSENNVITEEELFNQLKNSGMSFIKPSVDSGSGVGCQVINVENGIDIKTGQDIKQIICDKGTDWVIQERIVCHESIRKLYPESVNTFRIITYRWKDEIFHIPVIMRIGQGGSNLDNAHAGGMFIAVNDDGSLHKKAFTEFKQEFTEHPDTHLKFENYKIALFPKVLNAAVKCHTMIPQLGCINWDFTIDEDGNPVLIEANIKGGSVWLPEMAHGCGPFGEKTPEILRWMRKVKHLKFTERKPYRYGKM